MPSRRQQKMARVIKESVSRTIQLRLSDPRITGLVSITEVDISPDSKNATVFLSILAPDEKSQNRSFTAICHAAGHIQAQLGHDLTGRTCPHLLFKRDEKVKKTLETLRLIEQVQQEYTEHPLVDESAEPIEKD
ncbi:MAG: 30S ribosome-binding factor RbfA [Phycisphaerae bacterium]|nr:30S ribosome-binding factor RbfA [Phycisphaerae bacterium]